MSRMVSRRLWRIECGGVRRVDEILVDERDADHAPHDQRLGLVLDQGRIARASMKQAAGRRVSPITLSAVLGSARVRRECARHQRTQPRRVHRQVQTQTPVGLYSVGIGMILCPALSPSRRKNFR